MPNRVCECGTSLDGSHFNRRRCPSCAANAANEGSRKLKGISLAADAVSCPVCLVRMNVITSGHFRKHGFASATDFKDAFGLTTLKAPSICAKQTAFMRDHSNTKGRSRTPAEIDKMSKARKGKGIGVSGKYTRTASIRAKISAGVSAFMQKHPNGYRNRFYKSGWVSTDCSAPEVWTRSSWERRVLAVLDQYPDIEHVTVEPFCIPYLFEGVWHTYTPDLLLELEGGVIELWEVKPEPFTRKPKNIAKFQAARDHCAANHWHFRVVALADIDRMERMTRDNPHRTVRP